MTTKEEKMKEKFKMVDNGVDLCEVGLRGDEVVSLVTYGRTQGISIDGVLYYYQDRQSAEYDYERLSKLLAQPEEGDAKP